jgi:hypothetical protein
MCGGAHRASICGSIVSREDVSVNVITDVMHLGDEFARIATVIVYIADM